MHSGLWCSRAHTGATVQVNSGNPSLKPAMEIHMINTHLQAEVGAVQIPALRPIMSPLCQCWPQRQTEEAGIVTDRAGIVYC